MAATCRGRARQPAASTSAATSSPWASSWTTDLPRWRLILEYDGAPWAGWQLQDHAPTVQGAVEAALEPLLGHPVRISAAGRTDSGVHAAMQVISFVTEADRSPKAMRDGLNARLPETIACVDAAAVPDSFDPRHSPHRKTYRYTWLVRPSRSPLRRGRVWHVRTKLDVPAMARGAAHLVGSYDFTSFRASGCTASHPNRTVEAADVVAAGDEVHLTMEGTGFLRHMVRIVAGTLYEVGRGAQPPEWMAEVLAAKDRSRAGRTAPAEGLLLARIDYSGYDLST